MQKSYDNHMNGKSFKELKIFLFVFTEMLHQRLTNITRHVARKKSTRRRSFIKLLNRFDELSKSFLEIVDIK